MILLTCLCTAVLEICSCRTVQSHSPLKREIRSLIPCMQQYPGNCMVFILLTKAFNCETLRRDKLRYMKNYRSLFEVNKWIKFEQIVCVCKSSFSVDPCEESYSHRILIDLFHTSSPASMTSWQVNRPDCFTWCTVHTPADNHLSILTLIGALSEKNRKKT